MRPWEQYDPYGGDPRADPANYSYDEASATYSYVGPAVEGMPNDGSGTLSVPQWTPDVGGGLAAVGGAIGGFVSGAGDAIGGMVGASPAPTDYNWEAAEPYGAAPTIDPAADPMNYDAGGNYVGPVSGDAGYLGGVGAPVGYGSGQSDYMTPTAGLYLGGPPATTPPYTNDPTLGGMGAAPAVDPGYGGDPGYGYDAGYGGGGDYDPGYGGGFAGDPGMGPSFGGAVDAGAYGAGEPPTPYGFDPFLWSQVRNPLPPPTPMRQQIMQEGGFSGPAWYPAPPPQPPGPMSYVRSRLGMQEPGNALEMKPPVPGFRFDGTPRNEPQENLDAIVAPEEAMRWQAEADERNRMAQFLPPMPPAFPRRTGY